jgi:hypothetical protein
MVAIDTNALVISRKPGEVELEPEYLYDYREGAWTPRSTSLYDLVRSNPAAVADFLEMGGVSAIELEEFIEESIPF